MANELMQVVIRELLSDPGLLQKLGKRFEKMTPPFRQNPQPEWMSGSRGGTVLPEGSIGGGILPPGVQLAGRFASVYGGPVTSPGGVPSGTLRRLPMDDRQGIAAGGNFMSGELGNETTSELRNRVSRSLLDFYNGDAQAAAAAYNRWLYGEQ